MTQAASIDDTRWPQRKISEMSKNITVGFVGSMSHLFLEVGVPLLRGQNIEPYKLNLRSLKYISDETHKKWKKSALSPGDVAIVRVGYPGTACVIPEDAGPLNAASLVIVRTNPKELNPYYLCYVLNSEWGKEKIASRLVGAAQQVFNTKVAADMVIPAPSIDTQDKIADILSGIDEKIELNRKMNETLEQMGQALFKHHFITNPAVKEWRIGKFDELMGVNLSSIDKKYEYEEILYIDISSVSTGSIDKSERMNLAESPSRAKRLVRSGDILWATVRPNRRAYSLVMDPPQNLVVSTGFAVISPKEKALGYCYYYSSSRVFSDYLVLHARGAAYPAVTATDFRDAPIPIPDSQTLKDYDDLVRPNMKLMGELQKEIQTLTTLRDTLLPRLISGKIKL